MSFDPFADDFSAWSLDGLELENAADCVTLSGHLKITRDACGLEVVRKLRDFLAAAVARLEAGLLPGKVAPPKPPGETANPFG